jgi:hypothetical protein
MNGLLSSHCIIVNDFIPFLSFYAENIDRLESNENLEKIIAANKLLQRGKDIKKTD